MELTLLKSTAHLGSFTPEEAFDHKPRVIAINEENAFTRSEGGMSEESLHVVA